MQNATDKSQRWSHQINILLCGASGFLGRHIGEALALQGHRVLGASSRANGADSMVVDYARDTDPGVWLQRLRGIDVVINAVGVLRTSKLHPIETVHSATPKALFNAAAQAFEQDGAKRRIIQISALGVEGNPTAYAATKREADTHLQGLIEAGKVSGCVLRPSIVFGRGGASSDMFVALSKLPVLLLPKPVLTAQVQPIAVRDLARGIAALVEVPRLDPYYECVGETALPLAAFIACLRKQQGQNTARVLALPHYLTRLSARLGDYIPLAPWCSETLTLLGKDNVSTSSTFAKVLAQERLPITQFWSHAWNT